MSKLTTSLLTVIALVAGLFIGLTAPAQTTDKATNYVSLSSEYVQDLNIQPAFDPQEYDDAYKALLADSGQATPKTNHIRFVGYTDHMFTTDLVFTIQDAKTESILAFIAMPNDNPVLSLGNLNGDEAELLSANIFECEGEDAPEDHINPCIWGNTIQF